MFANKKIQPIHENKELLLGLFLAFFCIFLAYSFPAQGVAQTLTKSLLFLFVAPALFVRFILKKTLSDFGINFKNKRLGISLSGLGLFFSFLTIYGAAKYSNLPLDYTLPDYLRQSFPAFLFYELVLINLLFFLQDFFFCGFLQTILKPHSKKLTPFLITAAYALISFLNEEPALNLAAFSGLILIKSFLSYQTESFLYGYFSSLIFTIILDSYIIHLLK